jgi:hypothetical protein
MEMLDRNVQYKIAVAAGEFQPVGVVSTAEDWSVSSLRERQQCTKLHPSVTSDSLLICNDSNRLPGTWAEILLQVVRCFPPWQYAAFQTFGKLYVHSLVAGVTTLVSNGRPYANHVKCRNDIVIMHKINGHQ